MAHPAQTSRKNKKQLATEKKAHEQIAYNLPLISTL